MAELKNKIVQLIDEDESGNDFNAFPRTTASAVIDLDTGKDIKALIPTKLPNPQPISIDGVEYDGSEFKVITIPKNLSELINDSDFITKLMVLTEHYTKSETYTKDEVNDIVNSITSMSVEIVSELPKDNISTSTIYFVPKEESEENDYYDEYIHINLNWELIGSTRVNLSGYATENWVSIQIRDFILSSDVNRLVEQHIGLHDVDASAHDDKFKLYVLKEYGKVLSDNNYDDAAVKEVRKIDDKVTKIPGKSLSDQNFTIDHLNKLNGIDDEANKYIHPDSHAPSIITQDENNRFVTDAEKTKWNDKSEFDGDYNKLTNKPSIPSITGLATETFVNTKITGVINSAPDNLNTLKELATAVNNDPNFSNTITGELDTKVDKVEGKELSDNNFTTAMKDKLLGIATGLSSDWKLGVENSDLAMAKSILLKQNRLTAGHNIEILPFTESGESGTLISSKGRSGKTLLFEKGFIFEATNGLPSEQGWTEEKTGEALIANVMVNNIMMTELTDSTNGGKADVIKLFTNDEFIKLLRDGGKFYGVSKLDQTNGNEGFWAGLQFSQSYRFGVHFRNEGGYLQVRGVNGEQVVHPITTFDGKNGRQRIWFTDLFNWEVIIPKNDDPLISYQQVNSGELMINKQPTGILVDYVAGGGIGETGCYLSSMSTGGNEHVSYHKSFGYSINTTQIEITNDVIEGIDDLDIITPDGVLDLGISFNADIKGRDLGNTVNIIANNIGGNISLTGNNTFLINGHTSLELEISEVSKLLATNTVAEGNEYSMWIPTIPLDGKSAYQQAKESGYTGTEEQFSSDLTDISTKTYVNSLVGDINSILDNINGEVI